MSISQAVSGSLVEVLKHEGVVVGPFRGQEGILHYGDWRAEYGLFDGGVAIADWSDRTQLEMTGADRAAFLNRMCTNQVNRFAPGTGRETFLTNAKGHVMAYLRVFVQPESLVLDTAPGQGPRIVEHLSRYIIRDRVEVYDRTGKWLEFLVAGPGAGNVLSQVAGVPVPSEPLAHCDAARSRVTVSVRCLEPAGRTAFILSCSAESASSVWLAARQAGARPCGRLAAEAFRIETGWPEFGFDITEENLPQEVARVDRTISFTKGCYLGQETVARIDSRGHVNKMLVGLKFATHAVPDPGIELAVGETPVGRVTSSAFSPRLGCAIALGYVRRGSNQPGTRLDSAFGWAEVVPLPI